MRLSRFQTAALAVLVFLLFGIVGGLIFFRNKTEFFPVTAASDFVRVVRVVDGDTLVINSGQKIRLIGVDTPETKHPEKGKECFGEEAFRKLEELAESRRVRLESDREDKDRYGRTLRYVWLEDGRMINQVLVAEGFGRAKFYSPNTKYKKLFEGFEDRARSERRGMWGSCKYAETDSPKKKAKRKH